MTQMAVLDAGDQLLEGRGVNLQVDFPWAVTSILQLCGGVVAWRSCS